MFNTVIKRDGREVPFEAQKIENAIIKAFKATGELTKENDILTMAKAIELVVETGLRNAGFDKPSVEEIQDEVEKSLMKFGFTGTAKAYILYRTQHQKVRNTESTFLDNKPCSVCHLRSTTSSPGPHAGFSPFLP